MANTGSANKSEHECPGDQGNAVVEPFLGVEFLIVTRVEDEWDLADLRRVGEAGADRVHTSPEAVENGRHARAGVIADLAVVVADNTENEAVSNVLADRPFEVEVIPAVIICGFVLERGGEAEGAVELQFRG